MIFISPNDMEENTVNEGLDSNFDVITKSNPFLTFEAEINEIPYIILHNYSRYS